MANHGRVHTSSLLLTFLDLKLSLSAVLELVSLVDYDSFPLPLPARSLDFTLLSHVDPDCYLRAPRFAPSKPPESYHEVCSHRTLLFGVLLWL